jgi:zinc transport system ATP-binding protein
VLIRVNNVTISYEGVPAVQDASFQVESGDYLVILGENGSGKSSVMKAMLGLVRHKSGSIVCGEGLTRDRIGYLPQQTRVQRDFPASVEEVVRSGLVSRMHRPFCLARSESARAREQMELMEIYDLRKKTYRSLSGGQQQRVLLARALCAADRILLLDEPVTGLDPAATEEMYDIIKMLNDRGMAIVTVSHDMRAALRDARHVLVMNDSRVGFFGDVDSYEVWRHEND